MSSKRNPRDVVIDYFTTADPGELTQMLLVVRQIVRSRLAGRTAAAKKPVVKSKGGTTASQSLGDAPH